MKNYIINNLFELWEHIGERTNSLVKGNQYNYVKSGNDSWPSKVFRLNESEVDFSELRSKINSNILPNAISIADDKTVESSLQRNGFPLRYDVAGMYLDLKEENKLAQKFPSIVPVNNNQTAEMFAKIASLSFGYEVLSDTIIALLNSSILKLFIGEYEGEFVSCGLILLDSNGISGLHMIGTIPKYQGLGLGRIMTDKLLSEAYENGSTQVVLVASTAGERIYTKLSFTHQGRMKGYSI